MSHYIPAVPSNEIKHAVDWAQVYIEKLGWTLCSIPYGQKGPKNEGWNQLENCIRTTQQARIHWSPSSRVGMGVVLGHSKVVVFDIDDVELTRQVLADFGVDLDALLDTAPRLKGNPERDKLIFRQPQGIDLATHKLVFPPRENGGKPKPPIFELRAGLVQDCLPPTIHPGTNEPYYWVADPLHTPPPELPPWLLELWTNWASYKDTLCPWAEPRVEPPKRQDVQNLDVIGAFNQSNTPQDLLVRHGYKRVSKSRYLAPGSESGLAGVKVFKDGKVFSHHGGDPLADEHAHDAFDVYRILVHGGDMRQAVRAAAKELGMDYRPANNVVSMPERLDSEPAHEPTPPPIEPFFSMDGMRCDRWLENEPKQRQWILSGIMPIGKTGMLVAPGGTGKSQLMMQLAISVATGVPLFGKYQIENMGGVLAFFAEDDDEELHRRFRNATDTILECPGIDKERFSIDLQKNLFAVSMVGQDVRITMSGPDGPMLTTNFERFLVTAKQIPDLRMIILDPIIRFLSGDQNDAAESTRLVQAGERLSQETGAFVLWANHANKASMRQGGDSMGQEASRGSSALTDGMRWQMNLATMDKQAAKKQGIREKERGFYVRMSVPKNNYAPPFEQAWLKRGAGGYLSHVELEDQDQIEIEHFLDKTIQIIKERAEAGTEYSKRQFTDRFGGKAGELGCAEKRLRPIIEIGIERGVIIERPPKEKVRNVTMVLATPDENGMPSNDGQEEINAGQKAGNAGQSFDGQ